MLFSSGADGQVEVASLSRNEIIALVNTAAQLAKSVGSVPEWRWLGESLLHVQYVRTLCGVAGTLVRYSSTWYKFLLGTRATRHV